MRNKSILAFALAGVMIVAGCENPEDYPRTRQGAIAGAVIGAAAGAARSGSNDREQAVRGAVVGGVVGAAVGSVLDAQARELRRDLPGNIGVVRRGDELIVVMPQDLLFDTDSAALRANQRSDLRVVASSLLEYPSTIVDVVGHTDSDASAAYNQDLSERRASSVATELLVGGVPRNRVRAYGRGESQPVADNYTAAGKARNRRVEIIIRER